MQAIQGLHHITAVASDPQINVDFYEGLLGQRLVKTTVNFDDPGTYHLYYGDEVGTPGTALTFFPWPHMHRGRVGTGETSAMAYIVRPDSMDWWANRLREAGVDVSDAGLRFGQPVLQFEDPDGMTIELVGSDQVVAIRHWQDGPIPEAHALRGFHSVTLLVEGVAPTSDILTGQLGYVSAGQEEERHRFQAASQEHGIFVDIVARPGFGRGAFGAGSIHHIAFRTVDDSEQLEYLQALRSAGQQVTPVQDRQYFHSIYFREPGGVLFEVATDAPGFMLDESVEELGTALRLPPWHEGLRDRIEARLPVLDLPRRNV
ncbi:MAG: ring-cleaving dioxygenase [Bacteroidetes bacterium]|nr:ring-cleaving dioxygenase [Bacteroidota bacterium]MDA0873633.1 ring-cleaving dioxygenase [Bacteroidota bacterium]